MCLLRNEVKGHNASNQSTEHQAALMEYCFQTRVPATCETETCQTATLAAMNISTCELGDRPGRRGRLYGEAIVDFLKMSVVILVAKVGEYNSPC